MTMDGALYGIVRVRRVSRRRSKSRIHDEKPHFAPVVQTDVGGFARYEGITTFRRSGDLERIPGNPWFICTLWAAQWYIARAKIKQDLTTALELMQWAALRAMESGILPEQLHPESGEPISVAPLTWSHAEFVNTCLNYSEKLATLAD